MQPTLASRLAPIETLGVKCPKSWESGPTGLGWRRRYGVWWAVVEPSPTGRDCSYAARTCLRRLAGRRSM